MGIWKLYNLTPFDRNFYHAISQYRSFVILLVVIKWSCAQAVATRFTDMAVLCPVLPQWSGHFPRPTTTISLSKRLQALAGGPELRCRHSGSAKQQVLRTASTTPVQSVGRTRHRTLSEILRYKRSLDPTHLLLDGHPLPVSLWLTLVAPAALLYLQKRTTTTVQYSQSERCDPQQTSEPRQGGPHVLYLHKLDLHKPFSLGSTAKD